MMIRRFYHSRINPGLLTLALIAALVLAGCGADETGNISDDPHAGYDHGPGEHELAVHDANDTHAGHDHGPGQHSDGAGEAPDWCFEHAVPESSCTLCHPELAAQFKQAGDWCVGHGLPESHCRLCNPSLTFPQEEAILARADDPVEDEVTVSLWFRDNSDVCATDGSLIQFASSRTPLKAGLTVQTAQPSDLEGSIEAPAEVVFDESRCHVVTCTVPALVTRWVVSPGDRVRVGDALAELNSAAVAELAARLLSTHAAFEVHRKESARHEELKKALLISDSDYEQQVARTNQAQAEYNAARGLLLAAGLGEDDLEEIVKHQQVTSRFALRANSDGILVDRIARLGELLGEGSAFALVADPSSMWIEARLTEEQLRSVEVGQTLSFSSDGRGLSRVGARIIWVSRQLDPHSRTGTVRAQVLDDRHGLQAGEFGRVDIVRRENREVTLVPKDAVQWEGCCNVVFVKETDLRFRPRKVELLGGSGPFYQITGEVRPGDEVVVDGSFLLKTELKKASLGSGCCGLEAAG